MSLPILRLSAGPSHCLGTHPPQSPRRSTPASGRGERGIAGPTAEALRGVTLSRYRFRVEALQEVRLPPFKGSALRGALGLALKAETCRRTPRCGRSCREEQACVYGSLLETRVARREPPARKAKDQTRPLVIVPPEDARTRIPPGDHLGLDVVLVGPAVGELPAVVAALSRRLARIGLGWPRCAARLVSVERRQESVAAPDRLVLWTAREGWRHPDLPPDPWSDLRLPSHAGKEGAVIRFTTPHRWFHGGRPIRRPTFEDLVRVAMRRATGLADLCGSPSRGTDFFEALRQARRVEEAESSVRWVTLARRSNRQRRTIDLSGFQGHLRVGAIPPSLHPWLALAEQVGMGKGSVMGLGRIKVCGVEGTLAGSRGKEEGR